MASRPQRVEPYHEPSFPDGNYMPGSLGSELPVPIEIHPFGDGAAGEISVSPYPTEVYGYVKDCSQSVGRVVFDEDGRAILDAHPDSFPVIAKFKRNKEHPWFSSLHANRINGRRPVNAMHTKTRLANGAVACRERFGIKNVGTEEGELDGLSAAEKKERREAYWGLVNSFDTLSKDQYVDPNNPIERWRAHSHFALDFDPYGNELTIRLLPHRAFAARHETNQYLNEEHPEREFDPLPDAVLKNPILHETMAAIVDRLPPHIADRLKKGSLFVDVVVNQFDVRTKADGEEAFITPEGKELSEYPGFENLADSQAGNTRMHIDGQDMIVVMLVREDNVENDYVFVASTDKPGKADKFRLDRAGDLYLLDESMPAEDGSRQQKTMHGVAPMRSTKSGEVASRRVLIFNLNFRTPDEQIALQESFRETDVLSTNVPLADPANNGFHDTDAWTALPDTIQHAPFVEELSLDSISTGNDWLCVA